MENCELYLPQSWCKCDPLGRLRLIHFHFGVSCTALLQTVRFAVHVECGVKLEGKREVLAVEPMYEESEESYTAFFTGLKKQWLKKVRIEVSDANQGLDSDYNK